MFFSFSLVPIWCFSPFLLYSLYILLFRWSVGVCVLLQPWLQPPKKRILIMRESPPHRISATPLLNSEEKGKGEGRRGGTTTWRRIHSGNNLFHSNQHWIWSTVAFECHFRRNRLIQSSLMVVEQLAWWYQVCLFFIPYLTQAFPNYTEILSFKWWVEYHLAERSQQVLPKKVYSLCNHKHIRSYTHVEWYMCKHKANQPGSPHTHTWEYK